MLECKHETKIKISKVVQESPRQLLAQLMARLAALRAIRCLCNWRGHLRLHEPVESGNVAVCYRSELGRCPGSYDLGCRADQPLNPLVQMLGS